MSQEPITIRTNPDSELALLMKEAAVSTVPVRVNTGEAVYRLTVSTEDARPARGGGSHEEDVQASRDGILRAAGSWKDIDADAFKAYIRERRRSSSRPPVAI